MSDRREDLSFEMSDDVKGEQQSTATAQAEMPSVNTKNGNRVTRILLETELIHELERQLRSAEEKTTAILEQITVAKREFNSTGAELVKERRRREQTVGQLKKKIDGIESQRTTFAQQREAYLKAAADCQAAMGQLQLEMEETQLLLDTSAANIEASVADLEIRMLASRGDLVRLERELEAENSLKAEQSALLKEKLKQRLNRIAGEGVRMEQDRQATEEKLALMKQPEDRMEVVGHAEEPNYPTCWSTRDKSRLLEITSADRRSVVHTGAGFGIYAAIRTNHPIPVRVNTCYYYEVKVNKQYGHHWNGAIGLSESASRRTPPGETTRTYYYRDGYLYSSGMIGHNYGPTLKSGDLVGCGLVFKQDGGELFYTLNGANLGVARVNIPLSSPLFPTVALYSEGEIAEANFGTKLFVFNIEEYKRQRQQAIN